MKFIWTEENLNYDTDITKIKPSFVKLIQTKKQFELKVSQDSYERNWIHHTPLDIYGNEISYFIPW